MKNGEVNFFAAAVDGMDGRAQRALQFQRRYVMLCRRHNLGLHPLTGALPVRVPCMDMGYPFPERHPDFWAARDALLAEFADAQTSMWLRHVTFSEDQLRDDTIQGGGTYDGMTPAEVLADRDAYNRACGE